MQTRGTVIALAVVLAVAVAGHLAGCSGAAEPSLKTHGGVTAGVERLPGDRVLAKGWVTRQDIEGGFWSLVDLSPANAEGREPRVIAVLLPGDVTDQDIARLEGTFIGAEGKLQEGASIRMAGPEVVVDAVRVY